MTVRLFSPFLAILFVDQLVYRYSLVEGNDVVTLVIPRGLSTIQCHPSKRSPVPWPAWDG